MRSWTLSVALIAFSLGGAIHYQPLWAGAADPAMPAVSSVAPRGTAAPPADAFPAHWQIDYVRESVFNSRVMVLQAGAAHANTVILIHGLGQNASRDWVTVIPALEDRYHVLAIDLPGFGRSERPAGKYSPTHYARVIHEIAAKYAKGSVVVVGHSMGGAVALRYAAEYPGDLTSLVLVDVAGILEKNALVKSMMEITPEIPNGPEFLQRALARARQFESALFGRLSLMPDPTELLRRSSAAWNGLLSDSSNTNAALALVDEDFTRAIRDLPHPTYLLWGEQDRVAPLRTARLLAGRLRNAALFTFPDAGHVPMSTHSREFNALLREILNGQRLPKQAAPVAEEPRGRLRCFRQAGITYRGRYNDIIIEHCGGIKLIDVVADRLIINDSLVEIENTSVVSAQTALQARESSIVMTNVTLEGSTALVADGSRLDLAGVSLKGGKTAIEVKKKSQLIFSVSDIASNAYRGNVHGVYLVGKTRLDEDL